MLPVAAGQLRIGMNSVQAPTQWIRHKTVHPVHLHCTCATSPSERPSWAFWMICLGECMDQRCHTGSLTPNLPPETIQGASTSHCRSCEGFKASSGMRPLQTEQPWWDSNWAVVYRSKETWHWDHGSVKTPRAWSGNGAGTKRERSGNEADSMISMFFRGFPWFSCLRLHSRFTPDSLPLSFFGVF